MTRLALSRFSMARARFFLRKLRHNIPRGALVLDVGSGGDPHPRADVLVERFVFTAGERTTGFRKTAPTVVADVQALPFRESAFGYSICSHVLEHVADPVGAAEELSRVSAAGYVETPSGLHEKLMPMGWHRWFVWQCGNALVFEAKPSPFLDERLGDYFRSKWERDRAFMRLVWSHVDDLFVQHEWEGQLCVEASSPPQRWRTDTDPEERTEVGDAPRDSDLKRLLYQVLSILRYGRHR